MVLFLLTCLFYFVFITTRIASQPTSAVDYEALYALYNATRGEDWSWSFVGKFGIPWNFTSGSDPCADDWQGVNCTLPAPYTTHAVSALFLPNNHLVGSLPASIKNFEHLRSLDLAYNDLHYSIPPEICSLTTLESIELRNNQITGTIPFCLGNLSQLVSFDLSNNYIRGVVPPSTQNLTRLVSFDVHHNALQGSFPDAFLCLPNLKFLTLSENSLRGRLDGLDFSSMVGLVALNLRQNSFSGPLPASVGSLSSLQGLNLDQNAFTGLLPQAWSGLTALAQLALYVNRLTGPIPAFLQGCHNLSFLDLGNNQLSGTLPAYLNTLTALRELYVNHNLLQGPLPDFPPNLRLMLLEYNEFTGTIPYSTGFLASATEFVFYYNHLHGTIPDSWSSLESMQFIDLGTNDFSGTFPSFLGNLPMVYFYADENHFSGTIPNSLGNWVQLKAILLYNNELHGTIPTSFSRFASLNVLALDYNHLTGSINGIVNATSQLDLNVVKVNSNQLTGTLPETLFRLPALHTLVLGSNCFTGTLPADICAQRSLLSVSLDGLSSASSCRISMLGSLTSSYLSRELFHGTVMPCLFALPNLNTLHLSGMGLSGSLPSHISVNQHLLNLALSHNRLTGSLPNAFQSRAWENFDVSYNKLDGTLSGDFGAARFGNSSLSLETNRLSGHIPKAIRQLRRVSVLGSNLFACKGDNSDLPRHDADTRTYSCGSNSFETIYYGWIATLGVCLCLALLAWRRRDLLPGAAALATRWRKWLNASKGIININNSEQQAGVTAQYEYRTVALVNQVIRVLCRTVIKCTLYILVLLLPFYCLVSAFYGTYTHEYAYTASAAFLRGELPMAFETVLFLGLLLIVLQSFLRRLVAFSVEERAVRSDARLLARSISGTGFSATTSKKPTTTLLRNLSVYAAFALANVVTVVGVNVAFVYMVIYQANDLLFVSEVALAVFKIAWNEFGSTYLLRWASSLVVYEEQADKKCKHAENTRLILIQVFVALLNNVAIPCLVVGVVSKSCFYSVFADAPTVTTPYAYQLCIQVVDGKCKTKSVNFGYSTYQPPFTYTFLCSSSFVTYYAPVFVALCVIKTFVVPLGQLLALQVYSHSAPGSLIFRTADAILFAILKPVHKEDSRRYQEYYRVSRLLVELTNIFGLLLTFGAVFPPLGAALMVTIVAVTYFSRLSLGRFICNALEKGHPEFVEIIELEGQRAGPVEVLRQSAWMLIVFASCFYTLFLFDTLGDAVGGDNAIWVLFVVPSLPLWLYLAFSGYNRFGSSWCRMVWLAGPSDSSEASGTEAPGPSSTTGSQCVEQEGALGLELVTSRPSDVGEAAASASAAESCATTFNAMLGEQH